MEMFCELAHTSKSYFTMACNRLEIISHEDVGDPQVIMFSAISIEQAKRHYAPDKPGRWRMMVGNAIRQMCRTTKSREGDHFNLAIGVPNLSKQKIPVIPDYAYDKHTLKGRKMGRGMQHFREEATKLVNGSQPQADLYEDESYRVLEACAGKPTTPPKPTEQSTDLFGQVEPMTRRRRTVAPQ
jgi:hypothetical protein